MKAQIEDEDALGSVSPAALSAYVRAEGWTRGERYGDHSDVYERAGSPELVLPSTRQLADYTSVMSTIVGILAKIEERDELQVYRDLVVADRDVIRLRAPESDDDGSIAIEAGVEIIREAQELMLSAACSARERRAAFRAGKIKDAVDYMERVRLGQTEHGSFIVTLLAPMPPSLEQTAQTSFWPVEEDEPFERRVTRTLADGLVASKVAAENVVRGQGVEAFLDAVKNGVSANSCGALAGLIERGRGLDVSITWARTRPTPEARRRIQFSEPDGIILREAERYFLSREPRPDERLEALVVALDRKPESDQGRVTLRSLIDGRPTSITTILPPMLYSSAVTAHDQKLPLAITGDLKRHGQRWQLENPREVSVLAVEDDEQ